MDKRNFVRICYLSRPADPRIPESEISTILAVSRRNNAGCGVTGALIFNRGTFGQILEGPEEAVEETFLRIEADPRHDDLEVLELKTVEGPAFADWSMGFVGRPASMGGGTIEAHRLTHDLSAMDGDRMFTTMQSIALGRDAALVIR